MDVDGNFFYYEGCSECEERKKRHEENEKIQREVARIELSKRIKQGKIEAAKRKVKRAEEEKVFMKKWEEERVERERVEKIKYSLEELGIKTINFRDDLIKI